MGEDHFDLLRRSVHRFMSSIDDTGSVALPNPPKGARTVLTLEFQYTTNGFLAMQTQLLGLENGSTANI